MAFVISKHIKGGFKQASTSVGRYASPVLLIISAPSYHLCHIVVTQCINNIFDRVFNCWLISTQVKLKYVLHLMT